MAMHNGLVAAAIATDTIEAIAFSRSRVGRKLAKPRVWVLFASSQHFGFNLLCFLWLEKRLHPQPPKLHFGPNSPPPPHLPSRLSSI